MLMKKLVAGVATTAIALSLAAAAAAQSTGSTTVQELVVTAKTHQDVGGVVTQQEAPKTREIVSQAYIASQPSGANALSDLNLIPGVNFTNDDPYGMSGGGGHLSIRGIKGANIAELVDGVPLNDAGNYAIYAGELVDPEVIANVNVITGSTDVDSATSSSLGGLVNINTLTPTKTFGGFGSVSFGSFDYQRISMLINSGEFGPFGTKAWLEGSDQGNKKYTGVGKDKKYQINFKVYQDLHHDGDFIAVAGFYDNQVADFYDGVNFASTGVTSGSNYHPVATGDNFHGLLSTPWNNDYSGAYVSPSSTAANASFQGLEENPTRTGNIRAESRFTLLPNLKLTVDPSYQWVLANGEGSTNITGTDARLVGVGLTSSKSNLPTCYTNGVVSGIDLDGATNAAGNPVCTDSVRVLSPSNTQTQRYTVNTSLIWDFMPGQLLQFSYAYDHGHVRQTGEYGLLQADGYPESVFGGLAGYGTPILAADGSVLQKRNRFTAAELDQYSVEYIGKFFDDHLRLDLGVRDPNFTRDLSQYCYTQAPSNVYCTNYQSIAVAKGYNVLPFKIHTDYNKVLPNLGFTWNFNGSSSVFFDYTEALNAPVNDDLYAIAVVGSGSTTYAVGKDNVQPETSTTYELGYRYQTSNIKATLDIYKLDDNNHIVTSFNQATNDSIDTNVGTIQYYGVEGLFGISPIKGLNLIGSFAYNHSEDESNIPYSSTFTIETKGKVATDSPVWTVAGRATYDFDAFTFGLQGKFVDSRYVTLVNDLKVPSYVTFDADVRWHLDEITPGTFLQLNVLNVFDEKYIGSINVASTNNGASPDYTYPYAYQGAPRTIQVTLRTAF
jgi:iron complex outermembrane receptor protein